jgi:hypothetical protein
MNADGTNPWKERVKRGLTRPQPPVETTTLLVEGTPLEKVYSQPWETSVVLHPKKRRPLSE